MDKATFNMMLGRVLHMVAHEPDNDEQSVFIWRETCLCVGHDSQGRFKPGSFKDATKYRARDFEFVGIPEFVNGYGEQAELVSVTEARNLTVKHIRHTQKIIAKMPF